MELVNGFHGIVTDLPNEYYHSSLAIGSTDIKAMRQSPAHYKSQINGEKQYSKSTREAFDLGSSAHEMILERSVERFVRGPEVSSKAVKEWKAFVEQNPDKIVLTPTEYGRVFGMFAAFNAHPVAPMLLNQCKVEESYFAVDHNTGLWVKARPDGACHDFVLDYKTTSKSATQRDFANTCAQLAYDISAAHYLSVVEQVTQSRPAYFYWIVQETFAPYQLMVYRASAALLIGAQIKRDELLAKIAHAVQTNSFPGYPTEVVDIDLPNWAITESLESVG